MKTVAFLVLAIVVSACGSSSPMAPASIVLTIAPDNAAMRTGQTLPLTAQANGAVVTAVWTSDTPAVATVDAAGVLVGMAPGATTITASYRSTTAVLRVFVVSSARSTCQSIGCPGT